VKTIHAKLKELTDEQLIAIIMWIFNDLKVWTNEGTSEVSGFTAMLDEAINHQINKAVAINVKDNQLQEEE